MNLPLFIAKRYLISKKSTNVINIITTISVIGVTVATIALIVILSVINGFTDVLESRFNAFDPDLKITPAKGKTFSNKLKDLSKVKDLSEILYYSEVIEENALLEYGKKQHIGIIKGVGDQFVNMTGIDSMMIDGEFLLTHNNNNFAVIGSEVAYFLSVGLNFTNPIKIYAPQRDIKNISMLNADKALSKKYIFPMGVFSIQKDYDAQYVIVPINFARDLFGYNNEVSAVELKFKPETDINEVKSNIKSILGDKFTVKDRYEQHEFIYKMLQSEKWIVFLILGFILVISSFSIIGSITMLILDKKKDIKTLKNIGANLKLIKRIFLFEGWMISIIGAVIGLLIGALVCWLQMEFGLIQLQGNGVFIIDAYPVRMIFTDFLIILGTVLLVGYVAAWYPVQYVTKKYYNED
jgi:lipoprotein-releasing system permease protein